MKNSKINYLSLKYAALTTLGLCAYFSLMLILGYAEHTVLRVFNIFILYWGVHKSIAVSKNRLGNSFKYLMGYSIGLKTGFLTTMMFAVSIVLFELVDAPFIDRILTGRQFENAGTLPQIVGIISIEAIGSSIICTYASMQWLKTPRLKQSKKVHQ